VPEKYLPGRRDMEVIAAELLQRDFIPVQGLQHFRRVTKDERAFPPRPREGAELGFVFQKDDLTVVIWTTWLLSRGWARDRDSGWVVIEEGSKGKYFLPVHRTQWFVDRLLMEAKIARFRICHRPHCSVCGAPMTILRGKGLGARYWSCPKGHKRAPWDTEPFLMDLPIEARQHLARRRRYRELRYRRLRKEGKPIRTAMLRRKPWKRVQLPVSGF
jgi:hypothetical protein